MITIMDISFSMGELKGDIDPRMPVPSSIGDPNRPYLYISYDDLHVNLRLAYDHESLKLVGVRF